MPEIALGMDSFGRGHAQVEHQQGHGYGEDAVAQGGETFDTLSGNAVVEGWHRTESSGLSERGQNLIQTNRVCEW